MARSKFLKDLYFAVGILYFSRKFLVNFFDFSNFAHSLFGPKILRLFFSNSSTIPIHKGSSGPTIVRSIFSFLEKSTKDFISVGSIFIFVQKELVPAFPFAINIWSTFFDCEIFQASACSLPPFPIIKTFIKNSYFLRKPYYFLCKINHHKNLLLILSKFRVLFPKHFLLYHRLYLLGQFLQFLDKLLGHHLHLL